jgi:outer membrane autotransporter protein
MAGLFRTESAGRMLPLLGAESFGTGARMVSIACGNRSCVEPASWASNGPRIRARNAVGVAGTALALSLLAASGAQAQNCTVGASNNIPNLPGIGSSPATISSVIANTLTTASTAFLLQSTAFIGSPPNPAPGQQGGGVWVRGVGGGIDVKSTTMTTVAATFPAGSASSASCAQQIHEDFSGVQVGTDIAKLNSNGWNAHVGVTAGYLEAKGRVVGGAFSYLDPVGGGVTVGGGSFESTTQVPFVGLYAAATYGGFFVDGLIRTEYYQTNLNAPGVNLFGQNIDAHGFSFSGSVGYNWQIPNSNWFLEPSAGLILSRLTVDPFNYVTAGAPPGTPGFVTGDNLSGTLRLQDIESDIGRVGVRVGTTVNSGAVVFQPFAAVSVWHEFGPGITSTYQTCPGCVVVGATPTTISAASTTSTFGTFGQYSLGSSAVITGTGMLAFARVDYRSGANLQGPSATGGIRYQFTPEALMKARMPTKAAVYKAPVMTAVNWTGFYVGAFGGGVLGTSEWDFVGGSADPHIGGYILGGEIGYNHQSGLWVFGVEADLGKTNVNGGAGCAPLQAGAPMFQMTCNASANWIATATARVGYTWERALFYVKGGGAWTNEQLTATCNNGPLNPPLNVFSPLVRCNNPAGAFSNGLAGSSNLGGWTAGFGSEFALTRNWSAKAEYNYISFGDRGIAASDGSPLTAGLQVSEVKIGINYRFDGGSIVAKY